MKVLFDHLCFWQKYGGVPRYFIELMKRMPKDSYLTTVKFSNNEYLAELPNIKYHSFLKGIQFIGKARLESEIGKIFSIPYLLNGNFNIYHQTHYDPYAFKYLSKKIAKVTTIHDMNYYAIPSYFSKNPRLKKQMEESLRHIDKIITISNNSKNDICNYLNIPEDKVTVIYHGVDVEKIHNINRNDIFNEPYILFVGARNKYKNFDRFIEAFILIKRQYPNLKLYCAGNMPSKSEMLYLVSKKIDKSIRFISASDTELILLYKHALVFVFPSLYEGFGLPLLEAMASNCPMAISNTSCFPEIALDAASYFCPTDVDSIVNAIMRVLSDDDFRLKIIEKGQSRVKNFSWEKSVEEHIKLYNSLL